MSTPWTVSDTYSDQGPQCPHCGKQIIADEPHHYDEMNYTDETCDACGETFLVSVYTSTSWSCEPVLADPAKHSPSGPQGTEAALSAHDEQS